MATKTKGAHDGTQGIGARCPCAFPKQAYSQKRRDYFLHDMGTRTKLKETSQSAQSHRAKSMPTVTNTSQCIFQ